ncbi:universal stress protein, partial [Aeromonas diversa]|uniref:universal stress protein n=1 Tax=Aeromonas diversa TaxID=502790 RepID=UPI0039A0A6CD
RAGRAVRTVIEHGDPSRMIISYTETHDVDRIVLGSHGRSGLSRVLLGSVAETVARRSPVPVTIVR